MFETLDCYRSVSNHYLNSWLLSKKTYFTLIHFATLIMMGQPISFSYLSRALFCVLFWMRPICLMSIISNQICYESDQIRELKREIPRYSKPFWWDRNIRPIQSLKILGSQDSENPLPEISELKILDPDVPFSWTILILQFFSKYIFHSSWKYIFHSSWKKLFSYGEYSTI